MQALAPFRVRRVTAADQEAVSALSRAVDPDDYIPYIYAELLAQTEPGGLFVAEQDGQAVACFSMSLTGSTDAYFWAMRVHPAHQGQGLGTQLCLAQIDYARQSGRKAIYLLSEIENRRAHHLVQKCGFENLGAWIVHDEVKPVPQPAPVRARAARPADLPSIRRMREKANGPLTGVIAPVDSAWHVQTLQAEDFDPGHMAVVEGPAGLEGFVLYRENQEGGKCSLQIRLLEGTPEAAADLLAFLAAETAHRECESWTFGVPSAAEPLLAPLGFDPARLFRAYVFCVPAEKDAKPR